MTFSFRPLRLAALVLVAALLGAAAFSLPFRSAAAATPPPAFGAQFHGMWSSYTDVQRTVVLDQLKASGATWVRVDVSWAMVQPNPPSYPNSGYDLNWGVPKVDRVLQMVTARGLKPLVTFWLTPGWANGNAGERTLPTNVADYANAARWMAARHAGTVPAWEVWNEPNLPSFMTGADPVAYTRLLRAAYPAIKAGNSAANVVFGGPAHNDDTWIGRAYAAGAQGHFDTMSTHPYMGVADQAPETPDDGTKWTLTHVSAVRRLMDANGDAGKKVWFTEFGWSSHANTGLDLSCGCNNWTRGVSEATQGDYLVRTLKLIQAHYPYVTHAFWYADRNRVQPTDGDWGDLHNANYGLLYQDLTPKPVYTKVKAHLLSVVPAPTTSPVPTVSPTSTPSPAPTVSPSPSPSPIPTKSKGPRWRKGAVIAAEIGVAVKLVR